MYQATETYLNQAYISLPKIGENMVKFNSHAKQKVGSKVGSLNVMKGNASPHSDVSDKAVIIMLIAVVVISLLSLGLYIYTSAQDTPDIAAGQAIAQEAPSQGIISLEIVPPPQPAPIVDTYD